MKASLIRSAGYSIVVGDASLEHLNRFVTAGNYSSVCLLCDENTMQLCMPLLVTHCPALSEAMVIELEGGETAKSIEFCGYIWQTLFENKADKRCLMVNLGGGVVSDLGGFAAAVYKRGIDFVNVPTSLLAMADASAGGKTGINFSGLKNALGTITQPKGVFVFPGFLNTLPARHFRNGLAEIFKIALISDARFWDTLQRPITGRHFEQLVARSIRLKNKVVLRDPQEKHQRKILNFGHSVGHALEALLINEVMHGEAVVAGMIMESHIAWQKKLIGKKLLDQIVAVFADTFTSLSLDGIDRSALIEILKNDKKNRGNKLLFALVDAAGSCRVDVAVTPAQVLRSLDYYQSLPT